MSSLHAQNINKPIDPQTRDTLAHPETGDPHTPDHAAEALYAAVDASSKDPDVKSNIHAPMHGLLGNSLVQKFIPGLESLANKYHIGNFVMMRGTGEKFFESMPLYPRLGMHLLYYGSQQIRLLQNKSIEGVLADLSERQGKSYDEPESTKAIPSFIDTYSIQTSELLNPDISSYKTFNEFFYRRLRPDARPVQNAEDPAGFCSAADCRLTVYQTVDLARKFWIKGNNFSIPHLLNVAPDDVKARTFDGGSLAIFRLAPADYHRFHSPIDGVTGEIVDVPGQYYTVNPQAVNEPGFDVFTSNRRAILYMTHAGSGLPVAFVAIGAMLVGSIIWTGGKEQGKSVKRGDELGYFAYGGSTVIAVFPPGLINFDQDLVKNSEDVIETLMKVGYSLGTTSSA